MGLGWDDVGLLKETDNGQNGVRLHLVAQAAPFQPTHRRRYRRHVPLWVELVLCSLVGALIVDGLVWYALVQGWPK